MGKRKRPHVTSGLALVLVQLGSRCLQPLACMPCILSGLVAGIYLLLFILLCTFPAFVPSYLVLPFRHVALSFQLNLETTWLACIRAQISVSFAEFNLCPPPKASRSHLIEWGLKSSTLLYPYPFVYLAGAITVQYCTAAAKPIPSAERERALCPAASTPGEPAYTLVMSFSFFPASTPHPSFLFYGRSRHPFAHSYHLIFALHYRSSHA